jgi:propane monooxygenase coupling protein
MTAFSWDRTPYTQAGVTLMNNQVSTVMDGLTSHFGNDDFEEIMSTYYGRMVLDDRILLFANSEDAAEHLGFDPRAVEV